MDKKFLRINKMFCVLFVVIAIVLIFLQAYVWSLWYKMYKSYKVKQSIELHLNLSNNWVKEKYYGENGKRYSIDE